MAAGEINLNSNHSHLYWQCVFQIAHGLLLAEEVLVQRVISHNLKAQDLCQMVRLGRGAKPVVEDLLFAFG